MTRAIIGKLVTIVAVSGALTATSACGELARTGRSPGFLIIDRLTATSGSTNETGDSLSSDVETLVDQDVEGVTVRVPTIFSDMGGATLRLGLKNPGGLDSPTSPSPLTQITITRYRVSFTRADGRNTPGVDVPFGFDGGLTATVSGTTEVSFPLVTHAMKLEQPLRGLRGSGGQFFIHTLAEITFYGRDQAGNEVSASGLMSVNFGDFADPD